MLGRSISAGLRGVFATGWGVFGWTLAVISFANLLSSLFTIPWTDLLNNFFAAYRILFHAPIDFVFRQFDLIFPPYLKDSMIIYLLFGSATARRMEYAKGLRVTTPGIECNLSLLYSEGGT